MERSRRAWNDPREVVDGAKVAVLQDFAYARLDRIRRDTRRSARLSLIARKLDRAAESERLRRSLNRFLAEPVKPVDPEWFKRFLSE